MNECSVWEQSQQDGCCFVPAPCTVNILWQTQRQVARWLTPGSWTSLQRPINVDINKEGWGMESGEVSGVCPTFRGNTKEQRSRSQAGGGGGRVRRNEVLILALMLIHCMTFHKSHTLSRPRFLIWRNRKGLQCEAAMSPQKFFLNELTAPAMAGKQGLHLIHSDQAVNSMGLRDNLPGLESHLCHSSASVVMARYPKFSEPPPSLTVKCRRSCLLHSFAVRVRYPQASSPGPSTQSIKGHSHSVIICGS